MGAASNENAEKFQNRVAEIEKKYNRNWSKNMLADSAHLYERHQTEKYKIKISTKLPFLW